MFVDSTSLVVLYVFDVFVSTSVFSFSLFWFWDQQAWFPFICSMLLFENIGFPSKECMCVGSLPPPWIPYQFPYESNKESVCAGSLPPPRNPYQFPYENNKESVCAGSLPPPWIPYQFPYEIL